jgi:hypothetical protein
MFLSERKFEVLRIGRDGGCGGDSTCAATGANTGFGVVAWAGRVLAAEDGGHGREDNAVVLTGKMAKGFRRARANSMFLQNIFATCRLGQGFGIVAHSQGHHAIQTSLRAPFLFLGQEDPPTRE